MNAMISSDLEGQEQRQATAESQIGSDRELCAWWRHRMPPRRLPYVAFFVALPVGLHHPTWENLIMSQDDFPSQLGQDPML